jgi:ribosomal protein S18 acetylase RimI-like enzyme
MVGHDGHRGWVYYLAVADAARGEGLGRELMVAAEAWLVERDIPKIQFMVRNDNTAVLEFYDHLGYATQDCLVLGRRLD